MKRVDHLSYAKVGFFSLAIVLLTVLSGCDKSEENDVSLTDEQISSSVEKAVETYLEKNKDLLTNQKTDEEVKLAVENYFKQDQIVLGKQIIDSVNAFQADQKKQDESKKSEVAKTVPDIREDEHILGNKDADIVLFEYSDYHCPFCKRFHPTTHELVEKDSNIAVILRPMPLVHANTATPLHEVAECVGKHAGADAFWKFSDIAFDKAEAINTKNYKKELEALNIKNIDKITECYDKGDMKEKVAKTIEEGKRLGINGTPNSIIKNLKTGEVRVVTGAYPLEAVEGMIAELRK